MFQSADSEFVGVVSPWAEPWCALTLQGHVPLRLQPHDRTRGAECRTVKVQLTRLERKEERARVVEFFAPGRQRAGREHQRILNLLQQLVGDLLAGELVGWDAQVFGSRIVDKEGGVFILAEAYHI